MTTIRKFYPNHHINVFAIEGIDALGKSTLIENIKRACGFYQVIHFSKPEILDVHYLNAFEPDSHLDESAKRHARFTYQVNSFENSMKMVNSDAKLIFDRWHLGENVYAPMYRKYDGSYVFELEHKYMLYNNDRIRLILLTEDFDISEHFEDDGQSLGSSTKENRKAEQERFLAAFNTSLIPDKRIICVTDPNTGKFKTKEQILEEAIS